MGVGVYSGKDFRQRYVSSLEWLSEGVINDDNGDDEGGEGKEDCPDKAYVLKQEVCSRDEVMHVGMSGLWFSTRSWLDGEQKWQRVQRGG